MFSTRKVEKKKRWSKGYGQDNGIEYAYELFSDLSEAQFETIEEAEDAAKFMTSIFRSTFVKMD